MWGIFAAKDEMTARRARMRRLIRWRKRVWRHVAALPVGTLAGAALALLCHQWAARFPTLCAWFGKFMRKDD